MDSKGSILAGTAAEQIGERPPYREGAPTWDAMGSLALVLGMHPEDSTDDNICRVAILTIQDSTSAICKLGDEQAAVGEQARYLATITGGEVIYARGGAPAVMAYAGTTIRMLQSQVRELNAHVDRDADLKDARGLVRQIDFHLWVSVMAILSVAAVAMWAVRHLGH